jgi:vanillate O-demethylase monooxygenase subunit
MTSTISRPRAASHPASNLPDAFVHNAWYVAAWGEEVTRTPLRRVLLDEPVAFYRRRDGRPVALADRCIHRAYPLSRGKIDGDAIVCGYHGFVFQDDGTCTRVPGQENVPRAACVRAYPVVESGPFVWIWMGDPAAADVATIPDHRVTYDPEWRIIKDMRTIKARYGLLLDNLMDLSHETFIHASTIGSDEVAGTAIATEVTDTTVRCIRHMENVPVPPFYTELTGLTGTIDRWQDIEFHVPALYTLHVRVAPPNRPADEGFFTKVLYALTPETKHSTHDFWLIARKTRADVPAWADRVAVDFQTAVLIEDLEALEALEDNLPKSGGWQELSINNDRGGLQWRRIFKTLV